jgi:hypothetical protein|eukprot:COSAG06_NODE_5327_length_3553_cov_9.075854_3_plen_257_part_00
MRTLTRSSTPICVCVRACVRCIDGACGYGDPVEVGVKSSTQPKKVDSLEGLEIASIACGYAHTVAVVPTEIQDTGAAAASPASSKGKSKGKAKAKAKGAGADPVAGAGDGPLGSLPELGEYEIERKKEVYRGGSLTCLCSQPRSPAVPLSCVQPAALADIIARIYMMAIRAERVVAVHESDARRDPGRRDGKREGQRCRCEDRKEETSRDELYGAGRGDRQAMARAERSRARGVVRSQLAYLTSGLAVVARARRHC